MNNDDALRELQSRHAWLHEIEDMLLEEMLRLTPLLNQVCNMQMRYRVAIMKLKERTSRHQNLGA